MCQRTDIVTVCKLYLTYYSFVVQRLELYISFLRIDSIILFKTDIHAS